MIRVILIDDHPMFRLGVATFLEGSGDISVVGQADDGIAGMNLAESAEWDVAILDVSMPRLGGIEVVRRLKERFPDRHVVVASHFPEDPFATRALQGGASAFVSKASPPEDLLAAVVGAATGALAPAGSRSDAEVARAAHETLTPREYQVFVCILAGRSAVETAAELDISASTVSNHTARIKEKLNVSNRGEIITYAHRAGLIE